MRYRTEREEELFKKMENENLTPEEKEVIKKELNEIDERERGIFAQMPPSRKIRWYFL